jgi:hypothetical protein
MFTPSRDEVRRFFIDTWAKYRAAQPLSGLETTALNVLLLHPEYHAMIETPEWTLDRDFTPESGELNPFLHLSLHLAIEEQLSIDQPIGIRGRFEALLTRAGSEHDAKHAMLECLGETVWAAQRSGKAPDEAAYLECLDRKTG